MPKFFNELEFIPDINQELVEHAANTHQITFLMRWNATHAIKKKAILGLLNRNFNSSGWKSAITHSVFDDDGEMTIPLGIFSHGNLHIHFMFNALAEMTAAPFIIDNGTIHALLSPKELKYNEVWNGSGIYVIKDSIT